MWANSTLASLTAKNRPGLTPNVTAQVKNHDLHAGILTMRGAPVQKPNVRWTRRPIDICLS